MCKDRYDQEIKDLIPHREPMLLINKIGHIEETSSSAFVYIDSLASFYNDERQAVPAWVGLEYMGQTAALIGGYLLREGVIKPHLGFLLGTRKYQVETDYFLSDKVLEVKCIEENKVGEDLATFACTINYQGDTNIVASASLSVLRKQM